MRRQSVSMKSFLEIGSKEKRIRRSRDSMRRRGRKRGSANGRRMFAMMKMTITMMIQEKGGVGVLWRKRGGRGCRRRRMTWLIDSKKRKKLLRPIKEQRRSCCSCSSSKMH